MAATQAKQKLHAAMKQGLMNFIEAAKPHRRPLLRLVPQTPAQLPALEEQSLDPVELTMLAVNRLGPATLRTATHGKAATVAVPDHRTAEIFRAALRRMQKTRRTDRLVNIVVAEEIGMDSGGRDGSQA